jgi:NDP-sugar pyrophosphorylase family protein
MNAMILAAGLGTRLGALGAATPKILIEVGGRPLLQRHLEYLSENGVDRVVINLHHRADSVEAFLNSYRSPVDVMCVREERLLGTSGGVRNVLDLLGPSPFLVIYGDILVQEPVHDMVNAHRSSNAVATLAVHEADSAEGKGAVEVDGQDWITRFAEKENAKPVGPALINSGIYVLDAVVMDSLTPGVFSDFGQDVFPALIKERAAMLAFRLARPVIDIGTPEGLSLANATVAEGEQLG